jgi:RNA polymerase primary sigma factor
VRRLETLAAESATLQAYLKAIAQFPRLTPEEEQGLAWRAHRDADQEARQRLVESNLRFVVNYAKRYRHLGVGLLDLIHEGNLGLIEASRRFDPSRNVKFITYAVWWIRESMMHVLSDQMRAVSFPPKLFASLGHGGEDVSLSEPVERDGQNGRALADLLPDDHQAPIDEEIMRQSDAHELVEALGDLDGKEREVVRLRYGLEDDEPRTLQEIGDRLHLSRERVRQIEVMAKAKLRRSTRLRSHLN